MKKLLLLLAAVGVIFTACQKEENGEMPTDPQKTIFYTSSDGNIVTPYRGYVFGARIISNTYENGKGVIKFDAPVTSIGERAFNFCTLTSVTIPDSVTSIGNGAFSRCNYLTSVTIPYSVSEIADGAFACCNRMNAFYGKYASSDNRCLIVNNTLIAYANTSGKTFYIPNSVTEIGYYAFHECTALERIIIPNSITSIQDNLFTGCFSLTSVTIPDSVTSIGNYAFYYCSSLESVTIPDSVTSIGEGAFRSCTSLTSVYCKPTTPPAGNNYMFYDNASGRKIYVPINSVSAYKAASYWSDYASYIEGYDF